jgi:hypothetical protein
MPIGFYEEEESEFEDCYVCGDLVDIQDAVILGVASFLTIYAHPYCASEAEHGEDYEDYEWYDD